VLNGITLVEPVEIAPDFKPETLVSVIVPFRNEENFLEDLIRDLKDQIYPQQLFEVIFVNDHSTDQSEKIIEAGIKDLTNFHYLNLDNEKGKKAALKCGFNKSKGEFVLTIDADCRVGKKWILSHVASQNQQISDLQLGPVKLQSRKGLLHHFQLFENLALQATTIGSLGMKIPILSNGANTLIRKSILQSLIDPLNEKFASGDDIFLLQKVKKDKSLNIRFNKSEDAIVTTDTQKKWNKLIMQHLRWFSKSRGYKDYAMKISMVIIGLANVGLFLLLLLSFIEFQLIPYFVFGLFLKTFVDLLLILPINKLFSTKNNWISMLLNEILYAGFSVLIFVLSFFIKPSWKERRI
jgi:poly-beta-1,6-N-acetyl-D-glucosamine synthase